MKVNEISESLQEKLMKAQTLDEAVQACEAEGVKVTREQLEAVMQADAEGELNEDALDCVSGGGFFSAAWMIWRILRGGRHGGCFSGGGGGGGGGGGAGGR